MKQRRSVLSLAAVFVVIFVVLISSFLLQQKQIMTVPERTVRFVMRSAYARRRSES